MCWHYSGLRGAGGGAEDLTTKRKLSRSPPVGEKAEVANANEALRENVQEDSAEELDRGQGHHAFVCHHALSLVLVMEGDTFSVKGHDPVIGNGDAMGVTAKVLQHLRGAAESGLGIDDGA